MNQPNSTIKSNYSERMEPPSNRNCRDCMSRQAKRRILFNSTSLDSLNGWTSSTERRKIGLRENLMKIYKKYSFQKTSGTIFARSQNAVLRRNSSIRAMSSSNIFAAYATEIPISISKRLPSIQCTFHSYLVTNLCLNFIDSTIPWLITLNLVRQLCTLNLKK